MALSSILRYCPLVDITWRCFSLQFCRWQCRRPQNCQPNKKSFEDVFDRFWSFLSSCKDHCLWCDAPNIRWTLSVVSVLRSCRQADEFQIWELFIWAYIKRSESRLWMGTVSFQISIQTFHKTYADEWYSILDTELIKLILNWHWIDHKCFVHFCTINYLFNEKRSFYHAFLKFRFNEPWPGPRIRTSRQSELGLALWVLLNVCVGPTLRWKAHLEGNGCAKQRSVYSV